MILEPRMRKNEEFRGDIILNSYFPMTKKLESVYGYSHLSMPMFHKIMSLGNPEGKTFLDLGCGNNEGVTRSFEPWLSRSLTLLGAKVIGLDLGYLGGEIFENYKVDLTKSDCLSFIKSESIDLAVADSFFNAPCFNNGKVTGKQVYDSLIPQLERIVKPKGYFVYDDSFDVFEL
jgi:SAM-dependent methyltransferase